MLQQFMSSERERGEALKFVGENFKVCRRYIIFRFDVKILIKPLSNKAKNFSPHFIPKCFIFIIVHLFRAQQSAQQQKIFTETANMNKFHNQPL